MKHMKRSAFLRWLGAALSLALAVSTSCSKENGGASSESSGSEWAITLERDGASYNLPVKLLNVFLVDDESYPETFKIEGQDVLLVGEFQSDVHVGYGVDWSVLVGRTVEIRESYEFWDGVVSSHVIFPGLSAYRVLGGSFEVEKVTGAYAGVDGDLALHGLITLKVETALGEETLVGTFVIHGVTWG